MEDNEKDQRYINGFNDGYLLSRFEPQLMKKIGRQSMEGNPYFEGMTTGAKVYEQEKFLQQLGKSRENMKHNHTPKPR
jgi:hypothetical protein